MSYKTQNDFYVQIDVKKITESVVVCNLYTGVACPEIIMKRSDYDYLVQQGFFIRNGKEKDDAGILNTTKTYQLPGVTVVNE